MTFVDICGLKCHEEGGGTEKDHHQPDIQKFIINTYRELSRMLHERPKSVGNVRADDIPFMFESAFGDVSKAASETCSHHRCILLT